MFFFSTQNVIKHIQKYTERNLINNTLLIETKLKDNKLQIMIFSNLKKIQ